MGRLRIALFRLATSKNKTKNNPIKLGRLFLTTLLSNKKVWFHCGYLYTELKKEIKTAKTVKKNIVPMKAGDTLAAVPPKTTRGGCLLLARVRCYGKADLKSIQVSIKSLDYCFHNPQPP